MNHPIDEPIPAFSDASSEREWLAQEEARRRELLHLDPAADDARMRPYRAIAHGLREPLDASLPADFARHMAAQVNVASTSAMDVRFERGLTFALVIALAVAAAVVATLYGATWLAAATPLLPVRHLVTSPWLPAFVACIGVSWLLGTLPRHAQASPPV
jgi:hypothetical protein